MFIIDDAQHDAMRTTVSYSAGAEFTDGCFGCHLVALRYLWKKGGGTSISGNRAWKRRYFVLQVRSLAARLLCFAVLWTTEKLAPVPSPCPPAPSLSARAGLHHHILLKQQYDAQQAEGGRLCVRWPGVCMTLCVCVDLCLAGPATTNTLRTRSPSNLPMCNFVLCFVLAV